MKRKYIAPSTELISTRTEYLLNSGSVVDKNGSNKGSLGSDNDTGGEIGEGNIVWGDSKQNYNMNCWDE